MLTREQVSDLQVLIQSQAIQVIAGKPLVIRPGHYTRVTSRPVGGEYQISLEQSAGGTGIILVDGINGLAGHSIGFIPEDYEARQEFQGPMVPGPWAYAFANCSVIDTDGGTLGDTVRAMVNDNRVYRTQVGGILDIEGVRFIVQRANNDNIRLVRQYNQEATQEPA